MTNTILQRNVFLVPASGPEKYELVGLHVRVPKALFDKLLARRDAMRKKSEMVNLSDVVRSMLEKGVREKR